MSLIYNVPSPTSAKNIVHFIQMMESKMFRMFDYGPAGNLNIYGKVFFILIDSSSRIPYFKN